jgi:hypothetical protein
MLKNILKLEGAQKLSKKEQKGINGGQEVACGGDGSFIFVNGVKTCCYVPKLHSYIC